MPSDGIWVKKTKMIHQAVKQTVIMDGSDREANEHMDSHFGALANSMMGNGAMATASRALPAALPKTNALAAALPAPGPLAITFPGHGANLALPLPGVQSLANAAPPPGAQQPGAIPVSTPHHSWISC